MNGKDKIQSLETDNNGDHSKDNYAESTGNISDSMGSDDPYGEEFRFYTDEMLQDDLKAAEDEKNISEGRREKSTTMPFTVKEMAVCAAITVLPMLVVFYRAFLSFAPGKTTVVAFTFISIVTAAVIVLVQYLILKRNKGVFTGFRGIELILYALFTVSAVASAMFRTRLVFIPLILASVVLLVLMLFKFDKLKRLLILPFSAVILAVCVEVQFYDVMWLRDLTYETDAYYISNFDPAQNGDTDDETHHYAYYECSEQKLSYCNINNRVYRTREEFEDAVFNYIDDRFDDDDRVIIPYDKSNFEISAVFARMVKDAPRRYEDSFFETYDLLTLGETYYRRDDKPELARIEINRDRLTIYETVTTKSDTVITDGECRKAVFMIAVPKSEGIPSTFSEIAFETMR